MKTKRMITKRKTGIVLLAGLCLFIWVRIILAEDDDLKESNTQIIVTQDSGSSERHIDPKKNIIAIHDSNSEKYNKNCKECHADIRVVKSLDPSIPAAHAAMFPATPGKPGDNKQCIWCHRTVDLVLGTQTVEKSQGNLKKQVDVTLCTMCHGPLASARTGPSGRPVKQFYQTGLSSTDGEKLYNFACAACHRSLADSKVKGKSADKIQAAIVKDKGEMGPLDLLSTQEIQAIADALAKPGEDH